MEVKMATAATSTSTNTDDFSIWLLEKLIELGLDESVYGSYIQSILESDIGPEEQSEELREILKQVVQNDQNVDALCIEINTKWTSCQNPVVNNEPTDQEKEELLVKLLGSQKFTKTKQKKYTLEEKQIREAILSQYSQMSDEDEEGIEESDLARNSNIEDTIQSQKNKREQAKQESQKKKEKDKEDREKQKQQKEEKKEKRKTQKGERRR